MTGTIRSTSPQRPDDVVGEWPDAGAAGVDGAAGRAREALTGWSSATAFERSRVLGDAAARLAAVADDLAGLLVREVGKPIT